MENQFMGVAAVKITGVYLRGDSTPHGCVSGSFVFDIEPEHVSWRDSRGHHVVLADEVIGISWSEE